MLAIKPQCHMAESGALILVDRAGISEPYDYCVHPVGVPLRNVDRKIQGKMPPPEFVPPGYVAVCPTPLEDSRLSRELQTEIFAINFGTRKAKPRRLEPLQIDVSGNGRPSLTALLGKEDGLTYYGSKPLFENPTAVRVLKAATSMQAAYSRMVLLRSPSRLVPLPPGVQATLSPDILFQEVAVTDGQAEVSIEFGRRIGLLPATGGHADVCFAAWQFRAILPMTHGQTALCKGMLIIDPHLTEDIRLRAECCKLTWPSSAWATRSKTCSTSNKNRKARQKVLMSFCFSCLARCTGLAIDTHERLKGIHKNTMRWYFKIPSSTV